MTLPPPLIGAAAPARRLDFARPGTDKLTSFRPDKRVFGAVENCNQKCSGRCRGVMGQYAPTHARELICQCTARFAIGVGGLVP